MADTDTRDTLVRLRSVTMRWDDRTRLEDVNLDVNRGDFIAITGPNGGGKTTLLRIMLRLLRPTRGTVTYLDRGNPVKELPIGYLPQKNIIGQPVRVRVIDVDNQRGRIALTMKLGNTEQGA